MNWIRVAAVTGALGVITGAFGAHALKEVLTAAQLVTYEKGVMYQFYHTFALLAVGILSMRTPSRLLNISGWLFLTGIIFFSGSVYLLATHDITGFTAYKVLGPVTPIGGLCFIGGWVTLLMHTFTKPLS